MTVLSTFDSVNILVDCIMFFDLLFIIYSVSIVIIQWSVMGMGIINMYCAMITDGNLVSTQACMSVRFNHSFSVVLHSY